MMLEKMMMIMTEWEWRFENGGWRLAFEGVLQSLRKHYEKGVVLVVNLSYTILYTLNRPEQSLLGGRGFACGVCE